MKRLNDILNSKKGFVLLYAVLVMSMLLALTFSITDLTMKERKLSRFVEESFSAFFAAESGMECVLYWDMKEEKSAFRYDDAEPGGREITCNGQTFTVGNEDDKKIERTLVFSGSSNSSVIVVDKSVENNTSLIAHGYSVIDPDSGDGVERGIQVKYGDKVDSGDEMCMFDIEFVIDNSRSICLADESECVGESENMQSLRNAAKKVVENFKDDLGDDGTKFSVIGFETTAFMQERLSATSTDIDSAIDTMDAVGGTNTSGGFLLAEYELNSDNDREAAYNIIILMTDGDGNTCISGGIYKSGIAPYLEKYIVKGINWCGEAANSEESRTASENETRPIISRLKSDNNAYLIVIAIEGAGFDGKVAFNEAFMKEIADKYYLVEEFKDIKDVTKEFNCDYFNRFINSVKREEF